MPVHYSLTIWWGPIFFLTSNFGWCDYRDKLLFVLTDNCFHNTNGGINLLMEKPVHVKQRAH